MSLWIDIRRTRVQVVLDAMQETDQGSLLRFRQGLHPAALPPVHRPAQLFGSPPDWWLPAPLAMAVGGVLMVVTHIVGDGSESWWSHTAVGWNPSAPERAGTVLALAFLFLALPIWALAARRTHPGWTLVMLLPWVAMCLVPLGYGDPGGLLVIPVVGIVALAGAVVNLARHSVRAELETITAAGG